MKRTSLTTVILIITGGILFSMIFWQENLALNAILFDAFLIGSLFALYSPQKNKNFFIFLFLHLFCLIFLILHNTDLSKISWSVTMLLTVAFAQYVHRSVWFAGGAAMLSFAVFIPGFFNQLVNLRKGSSKRKGPARYIRYAVIPLLIAFVFFVVYLSANNVFASILQQFAWFMENSLSGFFRIFSMDRIWFFCVGSYITGALLLRSSISYFERREAALNDDLQRAGRKEKPAAKWFFMEIALEFMGKFGKGTMALKNENTVGIISLALLNLLLLIINIIDIDYLWFNFSPKPGLNLSNLIHEGTEQLIFSIILAIVVLLFFFRGNLNFYKRNKWLRIGAYIWLLQNFILVISVLLRDYYYIREMGLAYKRIGVLFFLVAVLIGLITAFVKIRFRKTNYFLFRMNAFALVCFLSLASMVNWDVYMAEYNISHRSRTPIDLRFLLELSDKALPVLDKNITILRARETELNAAGKNIARCTACIDEIIETRKMGYLENQRGLTWLSWNKSDNDVKNYLK
ncbi:MAG: DUF4173 domain-containing protein [Gemmatimonadaceae bacterium]|nr:DUF4173 domain-containing protein [Chitinophagaceae bacterium]